MNKNQSGPINSISRARSINPKVQQRDVFPLDAWEFTDPNKRVFRDADIKLSLKDGWKLDASSIQVSTGKDLNENLQDLSINIESNRNDINTIDGNLYITSQTVYSNGVTTEASLTLISNRVTETEEGLIGIGAEAAINAGITLTGLKEDIANVGDILAEVAVDGTITSIEKITVQNAWIAIQNEYVTNTAIAELYELDMPPNEAAYDAYVLAYSNLDTYLNTTLSLFDDMGTSTMVTPSQWDGYFDSYYVARNELSLQISEATYNIANQAQIAADLALDKLDSIDDDGIISPSEKLTVRQELKAITEEYPGILSKATLFVSEAETGDPIIVATSAYSSAYSALNTYLDNLGIFDNMEADTTLSSPRELEWDLKWADYYSARGDLLSEMADTLRINVGTVDAGFTAAVNVFTANGLSESTDITAEVERVEALTEQKAVIRDKDGVVIEQAYITAEATYDEGQGFGSMIKLGADKIILGDKDGSPETLDGVITIVEEGGVDKVKIAGDLEVTSDDEDRFVSVGSKGLYVEDSASESIHDVPSAPLASTFYSLGHLYFIDQSSVAALIPYSFTHVKGSWTPLTAILGGNSNVKGVLLKVTAEGITTNYDSDLASSALFRPYGSNWDDDIFGQTPGIGNYVNINGAVVTRIRSQGEVIVPVNQEHGPDYGKFEYYTNSPSFGVVQLGIFV